MHIPTRFSAAVKWTTVSRIVTALGGGYALAGSVAALLARLAPIPSEQATAWGLSLSFAFYAAAILWALSDRRLGRVLLLTWGGAAACLLVLGLLGRHP